MTMHLRRRSSGTVGLPVPRIWPHCGQSDSTSLERGSHFNGGTNANAGRKRGRGGCDRIRDVIGRQSVFDGRREIKVPIQAAAAVKHS